MNASQPSGPIELVEFHDAVLDFLTLDMHGLCSAHFDHLAVYHQHSDDRFDVWSYEAVLKLSDFRKINVDGHGMSADYVSEMFVFNDDGTLRSDQIPVGQEVSLSKIEFRFGSGRIAEIECAAMLLELKRAIEHVEEWEGPL